MLRKVLLASGGLLLCVTLAFGGWVFWLLNWYEGRGAVLVQDAEEIAAAVARHEGENRSEAPSSGVDPEQEDRVRDAVLALERVADEVDTATDEELELLRGAWNTLRPGPLETPVVERFRMEASKPASVLLGTTKDVRPALQKFVDCGSASDDRILLNDALRMLRRFAAIEIQKDVAAGRIESALDRCVGSVELGRDFTHLWSMTIFTQSVALLSQVLPPCILAVDHGSPEKLAAVLESLEAAEPGYLPLEIGIRKELMCGEARVMGPLTDPSLRPDLPHPVARAVEPLEPDGLLPRFGYAHATYKRARRLANYHDAMRGALKRPEHERLGYLIAVSQTAGWVSLPVEEVHVRMETGRALRGLLRETIRAKLQWLGTGEWPTELPNLANVEIAINERGMVITPLSEPPWIVIRGAYATDPPRPAELSPRRPETAGDLDD